VPFGVYAIVQVYRGFDPGEKMFTDHLELQYPYPNTAANVLHAGASELGSDLNL